MNNGVLLVNKPLKMTSRDVVNKVCKILKTKKIGHTGTLDPNASGVLVLCVGSSTKIVQFLTADDKEYVAGITLGITSDTLDLDGEITEKKVVKDIAESDIDQVLSSFLGKQKQLPPMFSAIKVDGKRLHELARAGKTVERKERDVEIYSIERISDLVLENDTCSFLIKVKVSKGTYIRSLALDIGSKLGYPSLMNSLNRTSQGGFDLDDCFTLEQIEEGEFTYLSKDEAMLNMRNFELKDANLVSKIKNGAIINRVDDNDDDVALFYQNKVLAVYKVYSKDNTKMKPVRVFSSESS